MSNIQPKNAQPCAPAQQENADKELVRTWRNRRQSQAYTLRYQHTASEDTKKIDVAAKTKSDLTEMQRYELQAATMYAATGASSIEYGQMLFGDVLNILAATKHYDVTLIANAANDALISLKPQDEIEGMLCMRLVALHSSYMYFMRNAMNPEAAMIVTDANINRATKLIRLHNETLDALSRYRRKGEQKVTVQHINVTNHGKAIVNNTIETEGGVDGKN